MSENILPAGYKHLQGKQGVNPWAVIAGDYYDKTHTPEKVYLSDQMIAQRFGAKDKPPKGHTYTVTNSVGLRYLCRLFDIPLNGRAWRFISAKSKEAIEHGESIQLPYMLKILQATNAPFSANDVNALTTGMRGVLFPPPKDGKVRQKDTFLSKATHADMVQQALELFKADYEQGQVVGLKWVRTSPRAKQERRSLWH